MPTETLSCNNCGAPLEVPASANYATCAYCKARLTIKRSESAAYTEVLDRIDSNTTQMVGDLQFMRMKNQLEFLDKEWKEVCEEFSQKDSALIARLQNLNPGANDKIIGYLGCAFGTLSLFSPGWAGLGVIVIILSVLWLVRYNMTMQRRKEVIEESVELRLAHSQAEDEYEQKRSELRQYLTPGSTPSRAKRNHRAAKPSRDAGK